MRLKFTVGTIILMFFSGNLIALAYTDVPRNDESELREILKESADYCEKLINSALSFVCLEEIEERISTNRKVIRIPAIDEIHTSRRWDTTIPKREGEIPARYRENPRKFTEIKNIFLYDYQLVKKGNKIEESRVLLKENGKEKNEKNAELKTKRFYSRRSVFGPIGLLSKQQQEKYDYKIIKEEKIKGRKAVVIEALPKMTSEENPNYGKIWIDKEDFSILRIDVAQESLEGIGKTEQNGIKHIIRVSHYYDHEKNNVRFPSRTVFEENYIPPQVKVELWSNYSNSIRRKSFQWSKQTINYANYRFFTVETDVRY